MTWHGMAWHGMAWHGVPGRKRDATHPSRICPRFPVAGIGKLHRGDGDSRRPLLTGICNLLHRTTVAPPKFPRRLRCPRFSIQPTETACDHGLASRDGCLPPPPLLAQGPPRRLSPWLLRTLVALETWLEHGSLISLFPHLRVACRVDYEKEVTPPCGGTSCRDQDTAVSRSHQYPTTCFYT